jgi:hypothetical protein
MTIHDDALMALQRVGKEGGDLTSAEKDVIKAVIAAADPAASAKILDAFGLEAVKAALTTLAAVATNPEALI